MALLQCYCDCRESRRKELFAGIAGFFLVCRILPFRRPACNNDGEQLGLCYVVRASCWWPLLLAIFWDTG